MSFASKHSNNPMNKAISRRQLIRLVGIGSAGMALAACAPAAAPAAPAATTAPGQEPAPTTAPAAAAGGNPVRHGACRSD